MSNQNQTQLVYIGTYTRRLPHVAGRGKGIYVYQLDTPTGRLAPVGQTGEIVNPSYLLVDPQGRYLYAVQETEKKSAVYAFALNGEKINYLNHRPSQGVFPCHLALDQTGRYLLVANYGSGTVSVFPLLDNGRLGAATDVVKHTGASGANPQRQEGPHAHAVMVGPNNRHVFVADLGLDKIMIYRFDAATGKLTPHDPPGVSLHPGAGPRHLAFHPGGRHAFVINELDATVTTFAHSHGTLTPLQTVSALPPDFKGTRSGAAIRVAPSGRFVYASNRGHNSIAIFAFDQASGNLTPAGHESTQGQTPRDFIIDPSGGLLLAANQDSDTVVSFRINPQTGQLQTTGPVTRVPNPVCLALG